ncbi:MAG: UvrD-helicase domain-containing protein [Sulfuricaulis sp.]
MIDIPLATAPENNVVVHAAAGTGKTWLLTSRIIRLLLAGSPPGAILAITFTRKAAGEIYERVTERLLRLASCDHATLTKQLIELGANTDQVNLASARGLYEKHLSSIHTLRATTFHAFCQEILRRFPLEADVPPGFELIESTAELEETSWLALENALNRKRDIKIVEAMDTLLRECGGVFNTRKTLNDFVAHRSDWWAYTENQFDPVVSSVTQLRELFHQTEDIGPDVAYVQDPLIRQQIASYQEVLAGHPTATNREAIEKLTRALSHQTPLDRAFSVISEVFLTANGQPRQTKHNQTLTKKIGADNADKLIRLQEAITTRLLAARAEQKRRRTFEVSRAWYICGEALLAEYQRLKAERGLLDFSDLEWKTYRLLNRSQHAEWVQFKLDQRIDHLLVDEFQDTNPTQWRLMLPLLEEMAAGNLERVRSVFLVGDENQSIYRFRRADPRLFHTARQWLEQHAQTHTLTQHISWRSAPAIIHFVNLIFQHCGKEDAESSEDYRLQNFQSHETHYSKLWGRTELLPLIRRQEHAKRETDLVWRNPLEQPRRTEEDRRHHEEGNVIAGKIRELFGTPVLDHGAWRELNGDDVIILLRDRTHAHFYEEALRRASIPYIGTGRGVFLQSLEVRDILHLLRALIEPYNDLAFASALRSPVFAASDADLLYLAQHPPGPWRERLLRLSSDLPPDSALARAQLLLPRWSNSVDRIPVHDLLDRMYSEGNIVARYIAAAAPHLKSRVEANLNRFMELALEVDSGRYPSLTHFVTSVERQSEDDTESPAEPAWNHEPRVRVMTIHAAKGLEAPVVFLADAARDTASRDRGLRALIDWPVIDPHPRYFHLVSTKEWLDDISQTLLQEQQWLGRREETNLLYVALTRAKQMLYISGCEPSRGGRGWYGFIEKRLRQIARTGEAERIGLKLHSITLDNSEIPFNTWAQLEIGQPGTITARSSPTDNTGLKLDPALTKPLPPIFNAEIINPSQTVHSDDYDPGDINLLAGTRTSKQRRGVIIHRMLERLTQGHARDVIEKALRQEFSEWPTAIEFNTWWREACSVVDRAVFRDFFDSTCYEEARNEIPILYGDGNREIYGVIDRLVIRDQEIVLIDYKTHAHATTDNIESLARNFTEQMRHYGAGVRHLWPQRKLRLLLLFTACSGIVELAP